MVKAKKTTAVEVLPPEEAAPTIDPVKRVTAKQHHRIVTTYEKTIPAPVESDTEEEEEDFEEEKDFEEAAPPLELIDPIAALLAEIGASNVNYALLVNRLPNYERDQRTDVKSQTYCGALSIPDADYLREERYKEDIQLKWSRPGKVNCFLLQIRRNGRGSMHLPGVLSIEPLTPRELAEKAPESAPHLVPNFQTSEGSGEFKTFLKTAKELQSIGLFPNFADMKNGSAQPAPAPEMTDEAAILRLVNSDADTRKKLFDGIRGLMDGGSKQTGFLDILALAIEHGPAIIETAGRIWRESGPAPAPLLSPALSPPRPLQTAPPVTVEPPTPEQQLFAFVVGSLERRAPVAGVAAVIGQQADQDMRLNQLVDMFINTPAQDCLDWLAAQTPQAEIIANTPDAASWVEELQKSLSREDTIN